MPLLYLVKTNTNLTDGVGVEYTKHVCEMMATAKRLGSGGYVQGTDCPIETVQTVPIQGVEYIDIRHINVVKPTSDDIRTQEAIDVRDETIARLKALGVTDEDIAALVKGV